jgi:hypothetical protein
MHDAACDFWKLLFAHPQSFIVLICVGSACLSTIAHKNVNIARPRLFPLLRSLRKQWNQSAFLIVKMADNIPGIGFSRQLAFPNVWTAETLHYFGTGSRV